METKVISYQLLAVREEIVIPFLNDDRTLPVFLACLAMRNKLTILWRTRP